MHDQAVAIHADRHSRYHLQKPRRHSPDGDTYSAIDGTAQDFHIAHWGRLVLGGAGCVFVEATAVTDQGRITNGDLGIWSAARVPPLRRIADFMKAQNVVPAIQLAHAGR